MINKAAVQKAVEEWLEGKDYFLVDLDISADDRISVEIDHADGVWIEDCADLSRHIESKINREEEDYELEVGSAGLGQPFRVRRQYEVHVGHDVETQAKDGHKYKGLLSSRQRVLHRNPGEGEGGRAQASREQTCVTALQLRRGGLYKIPDKDKVKT